MSIIAGSISFSRHPKNKPDTFGNCFDSYKHSYYKLWQDEEVCLRYWHQPISPRSLFEVQPLIHQELVLVADLRLDNRTDLINTLSGLNDTATDSELVLAAYKKWHTNCVNYLVGGFAFAIWNRSHRILFCARDHLGQKPLFYSEINNATGRSFIFCTSPTGILNHSRATKDIDPQGVFNILMGRTCNEESVTLFSGIKRLSAGFFLQVNDTEVKLQRYWKPMPGKPIRYADNNQYAEGLNEKIEKSVSACINTNLPVSSFLSGGLDSSTVACMAQQQLKKRNRRLISTSFILPEDEDGIDEKDYINAILAENDFEHFYITREGIGFRECLKNTHEVYGGFPYTSHSYFNSLLPALSQRNVGVHLCGYGGDQVASYHGMWVLEQLLMEGRWITMAKLLKSINNGRPSNSIKMMLRTLLNIIQAAIPNGRNSSWYKRKVARKMISPNLANRPGYRETVLSKSSLVNHPFPWKATDVMSRFIQYDRTSVTLETLANTFLPYGIEYRTPFTDVRLINYCMSLPPEQFYLGEKRSLIRRSSKGLIPERIRLAHNKHQGSTPNLFLALWQEKEQLMVDLKNCSNMKEVSMLIDIPKIQRKLSSSGIDDFDKPKVYRNIELALYITWFKSHFHSLGD
jgi:asparagine synthase (glutamine-hydrolysing)